MGKAKHTPDKKDIINEYFNITLYELETGATTIYQAEIILHMLEEKEKYLECAGVLEAIQWYKDRLEEQY